MLNFKIHKRGQILLVLLLPPQSAVSMAAAVCFDNSLPAPNGGNPWQ